MTISCNALERITTTQTLKIEGKIKKKKVIVLIDLGSVEHLEGMLFDKQSSGFSIIFLTFSAL